jgi:DNA gyrase subunit B
MTDSYDARSIVSLDYPENVRHRPSMYIGGVDQNGITHLIQEILDNAIDEVLSGHANTITMEVDMDADTVEITDNGRGIPYGPTSTGEDALHLCMCKLHAGGKLHKGNYSFSAGVNGVGMALVNALSNHTVIHSMRDRKIMQENFAQGRPVKNSRKISKYNGTGGTKVRFQPDRTILGDVPYDIEHLTQTCKMLSFLIPKLKIIFSHTYNGKNHRQSYYHPNGLVDFINICTSNAKQKMHPTPIMINGGFPVKIPGNPTPFVGQFQLLMLWTSLPDEGMFSFVNTLRTVSGGEHETTTRRAITLQVKNSLSELFKKIEIIPDDIREGLTVVLSVQHPNPAFGEQTKKSFASTDVQAIGPIIQEQLAHYFTVNGEAAKSIANKISQSARLRIAGQKAKDRILSREVEYSTMTLGNMGGFIDALSRDRDKCELFIVEGDSAGGSAKQGRYSRDYQAVYCLKGKPLNAYRKDRASDVLKNEELSDLVKIIGAGIGASFNVDKTRYGKIFIMADADDDGKHIQSLLIGFFFKFMKQLIEAGKLWCVNPPLYRYREGNKNYFAMNQNEWNDLIINRVRTHNWTKVGLVLLQERDNYNYGIPISPEWAMSVYTNWMMWKQNIMAFMNAYKFSWDVLLDLGMSGTLDMFLRTCRGKYEFRETGGFLTGVHDNILHWIPTDYAALRAIKNSHTMHAISNISCMWRYFPSIGGANPLDTVEMMDRICTPKSRTRFKGLGEMNSNDLQFTSMNPENRNVVQLTLNDEAEAVQYFEWFLGSDPNVRQQLILLHQTRFETHDLI